MTPRAAARAVWIGARWRVGASRRLLRRSPGAAVLCYHRITDPGPFDFLDPWIPRTPPRRLAEHLALLRDWGMRATTIADLLAAGRAGEDVRGIVALTFDDGFGDWTSSALPALRAAGARATFHVVSDAVGAERPLWIHRLYRALGGPGAAGAARALADAIGVPPRDAAAHLKFQVPPAARDGILDATLPADDGAWARGLYPTADDARRMLRDGMEIGSHGATHSSLATLTDGPLREEVEGSRTRLEGILQAPVEAFAYPFGGPEHRSPEADALVAGAYRSACVTDFARWTPARGSHAIPRIGMADTSASELAWFLTHPAHR